MRRPSGDHTGAPGTRGCGQANTEFGVTSRPAGVNSLTPPQARAAISVPFGDQAGQDACRATRCRREPSTRIVYTLESVPVLVAKASRLPSRDQVGELSSPLVPVGTTRAPEPSAFITTICDP